MQKDFQCIQCSAEGSDRQIKLPNSVSVYVLDRYDQLINIEPVIVENRYDVLTVGV